MTIKINPYIGRGAPVSGERLVGRSQLLERLVSSISAEAHCSIVGLPRLGKTSLAKEALRLLQAQRNDVFCGYLTLDAISGPAQAYSRILMETAPDDSDEDQAPCHSKHDDAYEMFIRTLRKRRRTGRKSVVIVDEVDGIVREDFVEAQLYVSRIREVANDRERYGLTFVFVSRRSLDMIQGAVDCSTLAGLCEVIYLKPLERDGLVHLASRSPIPVEPAGVEALWNITGGHPFLAEVVMCEAVEINHSHIEGESINSAQHAQAHEFTNQYRQLQHILSHEGMFDTLCELIVGPRWQTITPHIMCMLKHYGVIKSNDQAVGDTECMSQHLKDYLKLLTRTTPSWVLLGDAERQLRYLVQDRMLDAYGAAWLEKLKQKFPKMLDVLDKLVQQKLREKRMFGDAASDFILDYAYIGDLKDLIFAEWERYRVTLGGAKADWERRFQDIMKVRNPMAHHRPVPVDVLIEAEHSCKAMLARLAGSDAENPRGHSESASKSLQRVGSISLQHGNG